MSAVEQVCRWQRRLIRLYPASFRADFGEELAWVFEQAAADAARQGGGQLLKLCLRELGDLPWNILNQVWRNREVNAMFERFLTGGKNSRYRRAGAIGLTICFVVNIATLGLPENYQLVGQYDFIPRMLIGAVAGAIGGAVWGAAWQPRRNARGAIVLGVGFLLARLAAYPINLAVQGLNLVWQSIIYLLTVALMGIIVSLTAGIGMGVLDSARKGQRLAAFGALGFVVGRLGYDVINIAFSAGVFLLAGNKIPHYNIWLVYGFLILGTLVQGYISGSWLGSACQPSVPSMEEGVPAIS